MQDLEFLKSALQMICEEGNTFSVFVRRQGYSTHHVFTECKHNFYLFIVNLPSVPF